MSEATDKYQLPTPEFPKMEMPEPPDTPSAKDEVHPSCEGEVMALATDNSEVTDPTPGIPRILIGIPILLYSHEFVQSFMKFWTEICLQTKGTMQVGYHFMYRRPVHMAEIELVNIAKFNKSTHLLLMDDDIYDVTLADLKKLLDADKDVISGVMYASKFPYAMCVFRRYDTSKKVIDMPADNNMFRLYEVPCSCTKCGFGLSHWDAKFCPVCGATQDNVIQKCDLVPFPFTLIKMSVFDKIKKPWFHCTEGYPSDSWFCDRCLEAGVDIHAHMGVRLNHNGVSDITKPHLFQMELAKRQATQNPGLVHLTEEEMAKHQYLLHQRMQEAEKKCRPHIDFLTPKEENHVGQKSSVTENVRVEESIKVPC